MKLEVQAAIFFPRWLPKMSYSIQIIDAFYCSEYNAHKLSHKLLPTKVVNKQWYNHDSNNINNNNNTSYIYMVLPMRQAQF